MLKEVTMEQAVMAPEHYEYLRYCAKEGVFGAKNIPSEARSPASSTGRKSQSALANAQPELEWDTENPEAPWWSPEDLAELEGAAIEDETPDAEMLTGQALLDQREEELAAKEFESNHIVEEKVVVKKRAPKNLKKDRKARTREDRKNR